LCVVLTDKMPVLQTQTTMNTDVVIITALKEEKEAVLNVLAQQKISVSTEKVENQTVYRATLLTQQNYSYKITLLAFNGMGNLDASVATSKAITDWNPTYIILTGIAGGFQKKTERSLGDVVVAEQVAYVEGGKEESSGFRSKPKVYPSANELLEVAHHFDWQPSIQAIRPDKSASQPKVLFGDVISSEKVIKSLEANQTLQQMWPSACAIEMEGGGTAMAVYKSGKPKGFLLVKAICDWADDKKVDHWHEYAAESAASFVIELLKTGPFQPQSTTKSHLKQNMVPYINQQNEIESILATDAPQYYLLDAPAGYGKTVLLQRVQSRFQEKNYQTAYVCADEHPTLNLLIKALFREFNHIPPTDENLSQQIIKFAGLLKQKHRDNPKTVGFTLLIDLGKAPSAELIKDLLRAFIPRLFRDLQMEDWFKTKTKRHRFRIIMAGRYLAAQEEVASAKRFFVKQLTPFNDEVILDLVWQYLGDLSEEQIKLISAHILHLSSGHPGCMAALLELYKRHQMPYPDNFLAAFQTEIKEIVDNTIDQIRRDIPLKLQPITDVLSVCRRLNFNLIRRFMDEGLMLSRNEDKVADDLLQAYLLRREEGFLQDGIIRPWLATSLRQISPDDFFKGCQTAKDFYLSYISGPNVDRPDTIMVELLYQELQLGYYQLPADHAPEDRLTLKDNFFVALNKYLKILAPSWNERERVDNFLTVLLKDWDFKFMVNYFLRDDNYNDQPYEELSKRVKAFYEELNKEK